MVELEITKLRKSLNYGLLHFTNIIWIEKSEKGVRGGGRGGGAFNLTLQPFLSLGLKYRMLLKCSNSLFSVQYQSDN